MPRNLCIAALVLSLFLTGNCLAQEYQSSAFGAKIAARLARSAETHTPVSAAGVEPVHSKAGKSSSSLVVPAVLDTPDRYVPAVQPASHTEVSASAPAKGVAAAAPSDSLQAPGDDLKSAAGSDRDHGFPTLKPSGEQRGLGSRTEPSPQGLNSVVTVVSSLAVVLGLFFMTAWVMRRTGSGGQTSLPSDVFEMLGRAPLSSRQQVHLMRCGSKLLLVSVTADGAETLTEIDDPDEVTRLAGLCKANQSGSASAAFRQVLHQFAGERAEPGFVGGDNSRLTRSEFPSELENLHG